MRSLTVNRTGQRFTCLLLEIRNNLPPRTSYRVSVSVTSPLPAVCFHSSWAPSELWLGAVSLPLGEVVLPESQQGPTEPPLPQRSCALQTPRTARPPRWLQMSLQSSQSAVKPPLTKQPFCPRSDGLFSSLPFCGQLRFVKSSATSQAFPYVTPFGL